MYVRQYPWSVSDDTSLETSIDFVFFEAPKINFSVQVKYLKQYVQLVGL